MKTLLLSLLALTGLVIPSFAQAPLRPNVDVKIEKVSPAVVKTPEYQITGGQNKRYQIGSWLEVEVEFATIPEMIPELTLSYKILLNGKLLVGDITHVNIPKGKDHYSVAYVSPRALENAMAGKQLSAAAIQGIWVEAKSQGVTLALNGTVKGSQVPNVANIPGMIMNKSQTPFAPLYWDRYEALKSAAPAQ
jgi:hypothetical protein